PGLCAPAAGTLCGGLRIAHAPSIGWAHGLCAVTIRRGIRIGVAHTAATGHAGAPATVIRRAIASGADSGTGSDSLIRPSRTPPLSPAIDHNDAHRQGLVPEGAAGRPASPPCPQRRTPEMQVSEFRAPQRPPAPAADA